jgi:hypothetical protein
MVLVAYAGPVRPAAALRDSVLCLPTGGGGGGGGGFIDKQRMNVGLQIGTRPEVQSPSFIYGTLNLAVAASFRS